MPVIGWNEAIPSNTSKVGLTPTVMRSILTAVETALGTNLLYWPGVGGASIGSIGEMQPGGPRTFFGAYSASSNSDDPTLVGRLFFASDRSELYCYDSAGTFRVGTVKYVEAPSVLGSGWILSDVSVQVPNGASAVTVAFPQAFYTNVPSIRLTPSNADHLVSLSSLTVGGLVSSITVGAGSESTFTLYVTAFGAHTNTL